MHLFPHPYLPLQASEGAVRRGRAMQGYLLELHRVLESYAPVPRVHLLVLDEADWKTRTRHPFGFPFQRTSLRAGLYVFWPARYPERLVWRLREALLPVVRRLGPLPGPVEELLDLNLGHEYAHAVAVAWRWRTRVRWVDEFLANYLYLLALSRALPELYLTVQRWGCWLAALRPKEPSLGSYERKPKGLEDQLWFQGQFTAQAARLVEERGDGLLRGLLEAAPLRRATVHRVLLGLEPGLRDWFAIFAPKQETLC
ncbi:hypothetical protein DV704_04545 [Meiothermus sp. QL-1]|uniref:hypothetical protein n=1 Tax=Meiothermus sp. QL-1 TaxID=2058095 RepID=UPI000E0B1BA4|nr:hypothetical protein [Meiothermus sp. QL-1]RDI96185.1 hypothetical protein DV704_04545 [Meiothermus sp. QL-1]